MSQKRRRLAENEINEPIGENDTQSHALITVMMMQMLERVEKQKLLSFLEPHIDIYLDKWRKRLLCVVEKEFVIFQGDTHPMTNLIKEDIARESKIQAEISTKEL